MVQKECKNLKECLQNLARSEQKLTSNLSLCNLVHEDDKFRTLAEEYHSVSKQMGEKVKEFSDTLQFTIVEPLKKLGNEFGSAQTAIKKRDLLVADLLPIKNKLEKLKDRDRTGTNIARSEQLKKSLHSQHEEFRKANRELLNDMNYLLDLKGDYIEPSLLAFIRAETVYYGECMKLFSSLMQPASDLNSPSLDTNLTEPPASDLIAQFSQDMQAMRLLSIVADR